ncbi:MAG: hypothetical protein AAEJ57_05545, partial [Opitutales bacterium]
DKTAVLENRFEENENRAHKYNSFIEQARADLKKIRDARAPLHPMPSFPEREPSLPISPPNPPIEAPVRPVSPKPLAPIAKPRESKGYYMQIFGGFVNPDTGSYKKNGDEFPIESDNGFSSGIVYGRDFGKFRLEGEISGRKYTHASINLSGLPPFGVEPITGYSSAVGGLVTAFYDIELTESLCLFLGIGTGVSGAMLNIKQVSGAEVNTIYRDTLFSYQILTGFAWDFAKRASARFVYKYFTTAGSQDFDRLGAHNLELGLQVDL